MAHGLGNWRKLALMKASVVYCSNGINGVAAMTKIAVVLVMCENMKS
jgi:hypothetical protein